MSSILIEVKGLDQLAAALKQFPEKIARKEVDKSLKEAATPILRQARANAPVLAHSTNYRRAGVLKRSIRMKLFRVQGGLNRGVTIGVRKLSRRQLRAAKLAAAVSKRKYGIRISEQWQDPFYWYFVEGGTKKMQARNFLKHAFDSGHQKFLTDFRDIMGKRIEAIWNGR